MDDNDLDNPHQKTTQTRRRPHRPNDGGEVRKIIPDREDDEEEGQQDREVWKMMSKSFRRVQTVLDENRILIQQVNENHQSKIPDNLAKNVSLIQEINGNISKVVSLYSDLSTNFSGFFHRHHHRREINNDNNLLGNGEVTDPPINHSQ